MIRENVLRQELDACRSEMRRFQAIVEATGQELQQLRSHAENWQRERLQLGSELEPVQN